MNKTIVQQTHILPPTPKNCINAINRLETEMLNMPQVLLDTHHTIHAGVYTRTIMLPAGALLTGALIDIPTTLIINGHCVVTVGSEAREIIGHHVLPASAGRKQAFMAKQDTWLTMLFATSAKTVDQAEVEFTSYAEQLLSRRPDSTNTIIITEDLPCPAQ